MIVKFKKLSEKAITPTKAHPEDAGFDLCTVEDCIIPKRGRCILPTGIAMDIPVGYCGLVVGRSGNTIKRGLVGQLGVIDSGYHDGIGIMAFNMTDEDISVSIGERVGQILIIPHLATDFIENDNFEVMNRGGGFGSTGK